jgi:hypothetical protein
MRLFISWNNKIVIKGCRYITLSIVNINNYKLHKVTFDHDKTCKPLIKQSLLIFFF